VTYQSPEDYLAKHAKVLSSAPVHMLTREPRPNGDNESNPPPHGEAIEAAPPPPRTDENVLLLSAWVKRELPLRRFLLGNVLCTTSRWIVYGETGVGKTLVAAEIAAVIAAGADFLNWKGSGSAARVMYLDGEMPAETFKERMEVIAKRYGEGLAFYGYNRDVLGDGEMPPLNTPEGEKWLWREIEAVKPDAIVFDSIMCLLAGSMSEEESWAADQSHGPKDLKPAHRSNLASPYGPRHDQGFRHQDAGMGDGYRCRPHEAGRRRWLDRDGVQKGAVADA
jgi:hypothetical protein